jgi:hypothetical protein
MQGYLSDFHQHKSVFNRFRANKSSKAIAAALRKQLMMDAREEREAEQNWRILSGTAKRRRIDEDTEKVAVEVEAALTKDTHFNFIKMHLLSHFVESVRELGHLSNVTSELPETLHRQLKEAYKHSNKIDAHEQILNTMSRRQSFEYRDINITEAKNRHISNDRNRRSPINRRLQNPRPGTLTVHELALWCNIQPDIFQNLVAWCLKTWFHRPEFFDLDDFHRLENYNYLRFNSIRIPVPIFNAEDEQEIHIIRSTGSEPWRLRRPPRNDTVLLWTGVTDERHFASSRGRIPARVDCIFHVRDPITVTGNSESEHDPDQMSQWSMALVSTLVPGIIKQPEGMIIVEQKQLLVDSGFPGPTGRHRKPNMGAGARYIVPVTAIQSGAHLIPIPNTGDYAPQRWYLSNTVDLQAFNLLY